MPKSNGHDSTLTSTKVLGVNMLDAPDVPDALPLMPDDNGHKIPVPFQSTGLRVLVPVLWGGSTFLQPGDITGVRWYWNNATVPFDTKFLEYPYDENDLPDADGFVPSHFMDAPGLHDVYYRVTLRESSGNPSEPSFVTVLDSDKVGPNQGQRGPRLRFPPEVEANGVDDPYLDDPANNGGVVATIVSPTVPAWLDMRLGDKVETYIALLPSVRSPRKHDRRQGIVATTEITQAHKNGAPVTVFLPGDLLRGLQTGKEYNVFYFLTDRSGRESGPSFIAPLFINLVTTPTDLRPVQLPQLEDGLINLADARQPGGVYMNILEVVGSIAGDILQPFWDLIALDPIVIADVQVWPIRVPIPYSLLASGGYEFTPGVVRADYTWQRGTSPTRPSQPRFVPVDLTVFGAVSPDNPDPINALLGRVTVKGRDGDNLLTINDVGLPVRVVAPLPDGPVVGHILELMIDTHPSPVATYPVQQGDVAGQEVEFLVDWDIVELIVGSGGVIPFFYWTFNGVNRQRAPDTAVLVNVIPIVGLKNLVYVGVNYGPGPDSGFISCPLRPWVNGAGVLIPGDEDRLEAGDEVRLEWASYANPNGHPSGVMPETIATFSHVLTADEARNGYEFRVPFDPFIRNPGLVKPPQGQTNPRHGSAVARYQVIKPAGGGMGYSRPALVFITLIRPGGAEPCLSDDIKTLRQDERLA
ncbi:hypothetical protein C9383_07660 [Pseudomonas palleroniana]|uniref:Uncharacterized protein n=2 Tax=Pseudomonas palleroniana TaxID=191390 RepID=A0A2T4G0P9_9PSED|nr:hypothetical protein [Pseudomonas palleroniana]KAB0566204.1 hypothetical protein F7R03_14800 [Pseudomonas palleroniana]PTC29258.1 hypothetical protein C9383_07660 [Pseudomonas palleroniana]